mgnify:FL=1
MDRSCFNSVDIRRMPIRFFRKEDVWVADVRSAMEQNTPFSMKDDVMGIEYIPLETTDSCLISNLTYLIMDDDFIFVQNGKTDQVFKFTRQGKFVCQIGRVGNGPGEYAPWTIENISLDVNKKEVFLNSRRLPAYVYSYDGEFLRTDTTTVEAVENRYLLNNGSFALSGASITPIQQSPWLVALKNEKNQMMATKSPFPANVPAEACYMQEIQFVPFQNSALAYTLCNDTVFRVTETGICPACVYDKKNGAEYNEKIADINEMAKDNTNTLSTIELFTFFETSRYFYFRTIVLSKPEKCFFQRLDKRTGEFLSQPVKQDFMELSVGFSDGNVIGMENDWDGGVPFCPRYIYKDRICVQVINAVTLEKLENKGYLKDKPVALQLDADDNPMVIVYTFKN